MEMTSTIVYQLTKNLSMKEITDSGFDKYYVDHTLALWPQAAGGIPFNACQFQSKGDPITDLFEDMAADAALLWLQPSEVPMDDNRNFTGILFFPSHFNIVYQQVYKLPV